MPILLKNTRSTLRRSLANDLTNRLRNDILTGRKKPGDYLRLQELSDEFQVSLSPIRESLSVLSSEGLVEQVGQRGHKVAPLLRDHFIDATRARIALGTLCLRISIEKGGDDWEASVVSSFWKLNKIEQSVWEEGTVAQWEKHHHRFHESLVGGCQSAMLLEFSQISRRVTDRFRRVCIQKTSPDQKVWKEHETIYELTIARRSEEACEALAAHIQRASDRILQEASSMME